MFLPDCKLPAGTHLQSKMQKQINTYGIKFQIETMYGTARLQRRRKLNRSSVAALILLLQLSSGDAWYQPLRIVRVPLSARRRRQGLLAVSEPPERNVVSNSILDENKLLKQKVKDLEEENEMLHHIAANRIVLENFEGEGKIKQYIMEQKIESTSNEHLDVTVASQWCDELEDGTCPVEPTVSFAEALRDRAVWLVGLLMLQSFSGIILARNEVLLDNHPTIIYFLTMLVGAGGNAGNQVRVVRLLECTLFAHAIFLCSGQCASDSWVGSGNSQRTNPIPISLARIENGRSSGWNIVSGRLCPCGSLSNTLSRNNGRHGLSVYDCL